MKYVEIAHLNKLIVICILLSEVYELSYLVNILRAMFHLSHLLMDCSRSKHSSKPFFDFGFNTKHIWQKEEKHFWEKVFLETKAQD